MKRSIILFIVFPTLIYALYNPFFTDLTKQKKATRVIYKQVINTPKKALPPRETIAIRYLGYIETNKGKFALVNFNGKNIVVKRKDPLYLGAKVFRVGKITTNYIHMQDTNYRTQTIYFTSGGAY